MHICPFLLKRGEKMRVFCDLHIHSALSPCGDMDMTPNNIVGMSALKGLDFIAITDHNSIGNVQALIEVSKNFPVTVIPGMELETAEEAHFVCLFKTLEDAKEFYSWSSQFFSGLKNREDIFGQQAYMNENDEITGFEEQMLVSALTCSVYDAVPRVRKCGGIIIPAHVDKSSYSIIPEDLGFKTVEISKNTDVEHVTQKFPYLKEKRIITSSDSHYLGDIYETEGAVDIEERSIDALFSFLKGE